MANIILKDAEGVEKQYSGVTSISFRTAEGGKAEFVENKINYVVGQPVEFVLDVTKWSGTNYQLSLSGYNFDPDLIQIGIPITSSIYNAKLLTNCAITIPDISSSTATLAAVRAPTEDVTIAIWGLS